MNLFNLGEPLQAYLWLALALCLWIAEMLSGSFYLLAIAAGAAGAAAAAALGAAPAWQLAWAGLCGLCGLAMVHAWRARLNRRAAQHDDLDVGLRVVVTGWDADGNTLVTHRGVQWQARQVRQAGAGEAAAACGVYEIAGRDSNVLLLRALAPAGATGAAAS